MDLPVISAAQHILAAKRADVGADTSALDPEIDRYVYTLYDLTDAGIAFVVGNTRQVFGFGP